jgi:hypothetical protein
MSIRLQENRQWDVAMVNAEQAPVLQVPLWKVASCLMDNKSTIWEFVDLAVTHLMRGHRNFKHGLAQFWLLMFSATRDMRGGKSPIFCSELKALFPRTTDGSPFIHIQNSENITVSWQHHH